MLDAHPHTPPLGGAARVGPLDALDQARYKQVVALAFALAIGLGVIIGIVTAPGGGSAAKSAPRPAASIDLAVAAPALATPSWAAHRVPGTAHQVVGRQVDRDALPYVLAAKLRGATGTSPTAADVVIPRGQLFYGAVEGTSAATDVYWALGTVQVQGQAAVNPVVWRRDGSSAWTVVAQGAGACDQVPPAFLADGGPWKGRPSLCGGA